jgi:ABC-type transport system involved in cytochrome c biogenesis permease subunit
MVLGMPTEMALVFAATLMAGSLGAIHFLVAHVWLKRPFGDESDDTQGAGVDPGEGMGQGEEDHAR